MLIKNKRGQIISATILWFFATFFYFIIGYKLISQIVQEVFLSEYTTGLMYYFGAVIPIIPIFGLMFWGYTILTPVQSTGGFEG